MKFSIAASMLLLLASSELLAASVRCEACDEHEMARAALALGPGKHAISSFSTNALRFFETYYVTADGEPTLQADEIDGPEEVRAIFRQARDFYAASDASLQASVTIKASELGDPFVAQATAREIADNRALQVRIGDRLVRALPGIDPSLNTVIEGTRSGMFSLVDLPPPEINYIVILSDGDKVGFLLNRYAATSAEFQPDLALD